MKKIITEFLTNSYDPDVRVYKEAKYLVSKGYHVRILAWDRNQDSVLPAHATEEGIEVIRFNIPSKIGTGKRQLPAFIKYIKCCKRYLKNNSTDYYHCNDLDGAIAWLFSRREKKPMIFDMHEYYEDVGIGHNFKRWFRRKLTIFMIKKSVAALYENDLYLKEEYKCIHNKLFPLKNYPFKKLGELVDKKSDDSVFRIGYFGAVRNQAKEFSALFKAVNGIENVRVDIYGCGPDYDNVARIAGEYKNVFMHGPFDGTKDLPRLYSNVDIIYAGYRPYSNTRECAEVVKFYECIITGTPLILTSAYTGMAKKIESCGFGLTCDTLDPVSIREAVLKFMADRSFLIRCSTNEKREAHLYVWEEAVTVLDNVYRDGKEEKR